MKKTYASESAWNFSIAVKRPFLLVLALLFSLSGILAVDYLWIGGSDNWTDLADRWTTTFDDGLVAPSVSDAMDNIIVTTPEVNAIANSTTAMAPCDEMADTIRITMNPAGIPPDAAGREWTPYTTYDLPGNPYANAAASNTDNPGTPNSNGTSSNALYLRGLYDQTLDMHIPVPNGDYTVVLHYSDNASSVGARVFDVTLENIKVEDDFDVFSEAGGQYVALARSYPVTVDGNDLSILLVSETVNAIIQGIEIIPMSNAILTKSVDLDVDVTGCYFAGGESKATVQVRVNWNNAVPGDVVNISLGAVTRTIRPGMITVAYAGGLSGKQVIVSPQDVSFEVPADGATGTITANFNGDVTCETTVNFTAPVACEPTTCAGGAGVVGGYAFIDNNRDGTEQTGEILRQADVVVRIYESDAAANSTLVGTTTTDAFGNYSFSGLTDGERYRVEFDFPGGGGLEQTLNGSSNRTSVQFITSPTCTAHIGITDSEAFCQDNPQVLVPCYVKGNHLGGGANRSALVGFPYLSNGVPASGPITNYATIGAVGALWGLAYDKNRELMYSASTLKRHNGLLDRPTAPAEGMLGGIFVTDMTAPPASSTSFLVDLESIGAELGFIGNDVARGLTLNFGPDTDATAFAKVGKEGIGDIDVTPDGNFLFYTNLFERKLGRVRMDDDDNPSTPYTPVSGDLVEFDLPAVSCAGTGALRPWALKVYQGKVYVGAVCDAMGGSKGDLQAFVFAFDLTSGAFDAVPVFDFPLTYPKGFPYGTTNDLLEDRTGWHPWTDDFSDIRQGRPETSWLILYPVPILSDIEFDIDGAMVLGFMDRTSQQTGFLDLDPSGGPTTYFTVAGGDVLRAYFSNGNYILENNAKAGSSTGYGPGNNQGPGLGEFYNDNYTPSAVHAESFLGGLALRPGSGEVMTTALDPTPTPNTNGTRRLSNTTGQTTAAFEIVNNVSGTNRKGNSLGDLELACARFTEDVQIGGYVWGDANPDGVQASVEVGVPGVIVQLFDPVTGDLIATTTTDANGEYYFTEGQDSDPNTPGVQPLVLDPNTDYTIVMGAGQFDANTGILEVDGAQFQLTIPNTGQGPDNGLNDSNGEPLGAGELGTLGTLEGYPSTAVMTPNAGSVDHSFDIGLLPICNISDVTASGGTCDDSNNSHEVTGQVTFTNAPISGTLTVMIPGFGGGVQTFDAPFTSPIDYAIAGVASNGEMRDVIATFSEDNTCTQTATYQAPEQCLSCVCHNYIYLNEPGAGTVLKFRVEADSTLTLVGDPFASGIGSPHGLGIDANGFIYIGSATTRRIYKYSCDGTFIELVPGISVLQTNTVIKGNYLYTTLNSSPYVQCFDLCTYQRIGYLDFAGIGASWGLSEGEDGNLYVAGGNSGQPIIVYQFPPDPSLFNLTGITVYDTPYFDNNPTLTGTQTGIDVDEFGNVYLADMGIGIIRKIDPSGTILATAVDPVSGNGSGWRNAFGIVYNRETSQIYTTQNNPQEDCIAVFDTEDLTYRGDLRIPANPPLVGKGIGIIQECCPTLDSIRIDTTVCARAGVSFELNKLLPCSGLCAQPIPSGGWTRTDGTGGTFNDCDLSFTVDEVTTSSCFKFSGGAIGGSCFPYVIDICFNIVDMTAPVVSGASCVTSASAPLLVSTPSSGVSNITYQWQKSTIGCAGFLDIPGATGLTYTPPPPITETTYYRVKASSPDGLECEQFSNCLTVGLTPTPDAGNDQTQCYNSTFTMSASDPAPGMGEWTVTSGSATITTPTSPTTTVTDLAAGSSATLQWTVTDGSCMGSDEVVITNIEQIAAVSSVSCTEPGTVSTADDYLTFTFNATSSEASPTGYTLGLSSSSIDMVDGGAPPATYTYGTTYSIQLAAGSAGGGNITLTLTDADYGSCTTTAMISDPGSCSVTCVDPTASLVPVPGDCSGLMVNDNGRIVLTAQTSATHFGVSVGGLPYAGPDFDMADPITGIPMDLETGIPNTGGTYTVRIFNNDNDCYTDYEVEVSNNDCPTDPMGFVYCEGTGEIVLGGTIEVIPPAGGTVVITQDGSSGIYQFFSDGTPGEYTLIYNPPPGYELSTIHLPSGTLDPTGQPDPYSLGSDSSNGVSLDDFSPSNNPYYLVFNLASGDPEIILNNIPLSGCMCVEEIEAGARQNLCSTAILDLRSLGASISPATLNGSWTTSGTGIFDDTNSTSGGFATATSYTPSTADIAAGQVILTLTSNDPGGPGSDSCEPASDTVIINILKVDCGTFPWDGND